MRKKVRKKMSKVALMCGHGKSQNGTWDSGCTYAGNTEAALMLPITKAAVKYLRSYGVDVISDADNNNDKNMLEDVEWANKDKTDIYVSVHCDYSKSPSGCMPLFVSVNGKRLATALNDSIKNGMPMKSRGVVKRTNLWELNGTSMPACILECGSIAQDLDVFKKDYDKYGKMIAKGICNYLGVSTVAAKASSGKLTVDGKGGAKTVKAMQKFFGVKQDGVISGQKKANAKYYPALTSVKFGSGGSTTVKKLQKWVGSSQDGVLGPATVKKLQKKLGVSQDGVLGPNTMKAFQKYLNNNSKAVYPTPAPAPAPSPAPAPTPSGSTNAAKIVAAANAYAWPSGTGSSKYKYPKGSAKAAYKTALKKYMGKKAKISQTDCGYFVSTCVRSALGNKFLALPSSYKKNYPKVPSGMQIVHKGKITSGILQPGDVIRYRKSGGQHTVLYIGDGKIAHASRKHAFPRIAKSSPWNNSNVKKSTIQVIRAK